MLAGLDFPTGGKVIAHDKIVKGPGADRGMVFQSYTLFPWMTVEENVRFGLKLKKTPKSEQDKITKEYLEAVGLEKFAKNYPKELSGGMKQRVAIARALANKPDVLLMDEPFGALDPQTKATMQLLLRQIWQKHRTTVVFVTHDIEEAVFLATKIYAMSARPGTVKKEIPVYLPYERTLELKDTAEFIALRREVNELIHTGTEE
jgi:NitT/TauT family transport system ATP-binding protein